MEIIALIAKYLFASTVVGVLMGHWLSRAANEQTTEVKVAASPAPGKIIQMLQPEKLRRRG